MLASSFELLKRHGIPVAAYGSARNLEEALLIAENIGFPLVLKIDSDEILHKTDVGGVKIVYSDRDFRNAFQQMAALGKSRGGSFSIVVQEHVKGFEAILGAKHDQQFGKVVMFGTGGIYTQIARDVAFRLVPLERKDALDMIRETKVSSILNYRGNNIPLEGVADVILKVSAMVEKESIKELDINPLFLGEKVVAADARVLY